MTYLQIALFAFFVGYLISYKLSPEVGKVFSIIAATVYVVVQALIWIGVLA